ncbi:hypothetical protein ACQ7BT_19065, partial [Escherichia coli]
AVLAVLDYTQLKSISDEEVREAILAVGQSVPLYVLVNKFVLTVSLLIFIMISAVACGIYTQMVKERVYSLKQSV